MLSFRPCPQHRFEGKIAYIYKCAWSLSRLVSKLRPNIILGKAMYILDKTLFLLFPRPSPSAFPNYPAIYRGTRWDFQAPFLGKGTGRLMSNSLSGAKAHIFTPFSAQYFLVILEAVWICARVSTSRWGLFDTENIPNRRYVCNFFHVVIEMFSISFFVGGPLIHPVPFHFWLLRNRGYSSCCGRCVCSFSVCIRSGRYQCRLDVSYPFYLSSVFRIR